MSLRRDISDFLLYCELTKQYSNNTTRNYKNTLDRLYTFLEEKKVQNTEDIDLALVNEYRIYLNQKDTLRNDKMAQRSQAYQIIVLRSFLKFLIKHGSVVMSPDALELPKTKMRKIEYLTEEEIGKLISIILNDTSKIPEVQKKRNTAIILTMFGSGLRISELLGLKKRDVINLDFEEFVSRKNGVEINEVVNVPNEVAIDRDNDKIEMGGILADDEEGTTDIVDTITPEQHELFTEAHPLVVQGKGGKVRTTFLAPVAKEAIYEYMYLRKDDECQHLFISFSKNRSSNQKKWKSLTPRMVQMILQKYANRLGIYKHVTPHTLRHSFATKILFESNDLRSVQTLLGHSNIATTQIYTHITDNQIRELHGKVFGKKAEQTEGEPHPTQK
jgi:site-specific recombinase XerD